MYESESCVGVSASRDALDRRLFDWQPNPVFILVRRFVLVVFVFLAILKSGGKMCFFSPFLLRIHIQILYI